MFRLKFLQAMSSDIFKEQQHVSACVSSTASLGRIDTFRKTAPVGNCGNPAQWRIKTATLGTFCAFL